MARLIYYTKQADSPIQYHGKKVAVGPGGLIETDDQEIIEHLMSAKLAEQENLGAISTQRPEPPRGKVIDLPPAGQGEGAKPIIPAQGKDIDIPPANLDEMKRPQLNQEVAKRKGLVLPSGNMSNDALRQLIKDFDAAEAAAQERLVLNEQAIKFGLAIQPEMSNADVKKMLLEHQQELDKLELLGSDSNAGAAAPTQQ